MSERPRGLAGEAAIRATPEPATPDRAGTGEEPRPLQGRADLVERRAVGPYARLRLGEHRGMRLRCLDEAALREALAAHRGARRPDDPRLIKWDGRSRVTAATAGGRPVVVKEYLAGGILRRAAALWRGSPARRAWLGGHGLLARHIGVATPLAFLEPRQMGPTAGSLLVLEDLRPDRPADRCAAEAADPGQILDALTRLAIALHRRRVLHGDLKASHVYLGLRGGRLAARLIDLEGVRFARRLGDGSRIQELAELNASLPDAVPDAARRRAFARYAAALPFRCSSDTALRRIAEIGLDRAHRWTGAGCALASSRPGRDARPPTVRLGSW